MISDLDISERLLVAAVLGCLVGFERERLLWAAGLRTHMLVSVGAALLVIVSAYGFQHATALPHVVLDPSRIAAQVVSGIGFLGAGSILLRGAVVRGLTTAASVWAVAAIGLAAGAGLFFAATLSTGIILAILAGVKPLEEAYRARVQSCWVEVSAEADGVASERLPKLLGLRAAQLRRIISHRDPDGGQRLRLQLVQVSAGDMDRAARRLRQEPGVREVSVTRRKRRGAPDASRSEPADEEALR
ncbi:MAG: MgtC/SapB family protein [Caulobacteraceae bacterium]|nr:MgtC/SapB family protein [Caulobacter sp.]